MGLDMYLTGKRYLLSWINESNDAHLAYEIAKMLPEIGNREVKEISVEFMYWRKANAIHAWFVENVQEGNDECQETFVDPEELRKLLQLCESVLAAPDKASELLPTKTGFFFGSTLYDEWYLQTIEETRAFLSEFFAQYDRGDLKGWDFYYRSSW